MAKKIISSSSKIKGGRPCIKGTRTEVRDVVKALKSGMSQEDIIRNCKEAKVPISKKQISAALKYSSRNGN